MGHLNMDSFNMPLPGSRATLMPKTPGTNTTKSDWLMTVSERGGDMDVDHQFKGPVDRLANRLAHVRVEGRDVDEMSVISTARQIDMDWVSPRTAERQRQQAFIRFVDNKQATDLRYKVNDPLPSFPLLRSYQNRSYPDGTKGDHPRFV